jgi:hypothetical protein
MGHQPHAAIDSEAADAHERGQQKGDDDYVIPGLVAGKARDQISSAHWDEPFHSDLGTIAIKACPRCRPLYSPTFGVRGLLVLSKRGQEVSVSFYCFVSRRF